VLPSFYKLVKKSIGSTGFSFVPLDSPMFVVSVTLFTFLQAIQVCMQDSREGTVVQQAVLMSASMHAFVLSDKVNHFASPPV
jgi:hypothetical protein